MRTFEDIKNEYLGGPIFVDNVPGFSGAVLQASSGLYNAYIENPQKVIDFAHSLNQDSMRGRKFSVRSGVSEPQVVYGQTRIGGEWTYLETDIVPGVAVSGQFFHTILTYAYGEIESVEKLFFNDTEVTFASGVSGLSNGDWLNAVFADASTLGSSSQAANAGLVAQAAALSQLSGWGSNHRQAGWAHIYLRLFYNQVFFPEGFPDVTLEVKGKNAIYDPRLDPSWDSSPSPSNASYQDYTRNGALIIADFLSNSEYGFGADYSTEIDLELLRDEADVCEESVSLVGGGSENRYNIDGVINLAKDSPEKVLEQMKLAIGGDVFQVDGVWKIYTGKYRAPTITLTEDNLRGEHTVQTMISTLDSFNGVRAKYVDIDGNLVEAPVVKNSSYISADGEERFTDFRFEFVRSSSGAQRIAKLKLEENRQGIIYQNKFSLDALQVHQGDTVNLSLSEFAWEPKIFKVLAQDFEMGASGLEVFMVLKEHASGIFTWSQEETQVDTAPNTNLPNPATVETPQNFAVDSGTVYLDIRSDGTVFSRAYLTWDAAIDPHVSDGFVELQYKKSISSSWRFGPRVLGTSTSMLVLDVQDSVAYDFRIRFVNGLGHPSDWTTISAYYIVGKEEDPSDVEGFSYSLVEGGVLLTWDSVSDLDVKRYEIRQGSSFATGTRIYRGEADSFLWQMQTSGTYDLHIKAQDTTKNYSTNEASLSFTIENPEAPVISSSGFVSENYYLNWTVPTSPFPIKYYEIRKGDTLGGSTLLDKVKGTFFQAYVDWSGTETLWVQAVDEKNNTGDAASVDLEVIVPSGVQDLIAKPIDNQVTLFWSAPTEGTLPIKKYTLYKGSMFSGAEELWDVDGTFAVIIENTNGDYTFWVEPVDTALNEGTPKSKTVTLSNPPDFVLNNETVVLPGDADTLTNIFPE